MTFAIRQSLTMLRGYADTDRIPDPLFIHRFTDDADIDAWTAPGKISSLLLQYLLRPDNPLDYPHLTSAGGEKIHVLSTITPLPTGAAKAWARLIARPPAPATPDSAAPIPVLPDHSAPLPGSAEPSCILAIHINPGAIGDLLDSLQARGRTEELLFDRRTSRSILRTKPSGFTILNSTTSTPPSPSATASTLSKLPAFAFGLPKYSANSSSKALSLTTND